MVRKNKSEAQLNHKFNYYNIHHIAYIVSWDLVWNIMIF